MTVLIIGSNGLVGSRLVKSFPDAMTLSRTEEPHHPNHIAVDIFNVAHFDFLDKVSAVLFLAFPTNLDAVEEASEGWYQEIVNGFLQCVQACKKRDLPLLFVSSEAVLATLPPEQRNETEFGATFINRYAALKGDCEAVLRKHYSQRTTILRCTPVGFHQTKKESGFVGSVWARAQTSGGAQGFANNLFTPTSTCCFAKFCRWWLQQNVKPQVVHLASRTKIGKYDFLNRLFKSFGAPYALEPTAMNPLSFKAKRCLDQSLVASRLESFDSFDVDEVIDDLSQSYKELFKES